MQESKQTTRINCYKCQHFYITHEASLPYGCRAMRFKSASLPSITVQQSSGLACQFFSPSGGE